MTTPPSPRCSIGALRLGALVLATLSAPALANDAGIRLSHGPIAAGVPRILDLRTGRPGALVLVLRSHATGPFVPSNPAWPALGVAPGSVPAARATDAAGRLRIVVPASPWSPASGRSTVQALVRGPDGRFDATAPVSVRRAATTPPAGWLAETSSSPLPSASSQLGAHDVLAVDVDRDGDRDLVLAHGAGAALWIDMGAAGFIEATASAWPHPIQAVSALATADVDRDGDADLVTGGTIENGQVRPDRLWLGDGAGAFVLDATFPPGDGTTSSLEFGDCDGDGDADLLVARGADGHGGPNSRCQLLRNQGGRFAPDAAFEALSWNQALVPAPAARFGDVDDDGDLDVIVLRSELSGATGIEGEPNVLLENDGTGAFTDVTAARFSVQRSDNSLDATFADIDLDGDLDLVVANTVTTVGTAHSGDLWINQGGVQGGAVGHFVEDVTSPLESSSPAYRVRLRVIAADADTDGDPDLLVTLHDLPPGSQPMLLVNRGGAQGGEAGRFDLATWFTPGGFIAGGATFFDRDHDGDLELVLPSSGTLSGDPSTARRVLWLEAALP